MLRAPLVRRSATGRVGRAMHFDPQSAILSMQIRRKIEDEFESSLAGLDQEEQHRRKMLRLRER